MFIFFKDNLEPKKANEIFVEVENQEDNQVLTTTRSILYDAYSAGSTSGSGSTSGGNGNNLKKRKLITQKIIPENDLIEVVIDSSNKTSSNIITMKNLSFNLESLGTSMTPTLKKNNKLSKQITTNTNELGQKLLVLPERRTRSGNMSKKTSKAIESSINDLETDEIGKN